MKTPTKEEESIDKPKLMSNMLTKKMLTNQDHHTLDNRLDNSNIKADLELVANRLWLELLVNLQTKETQ